MNSIRRPGSFASSTYAGGIVALTSSVVAGLAVMMGWLISTTLTEIVVDGQFALFLFFSIALAFIGWMIARRRSELDRVFQGRLFLVAFVVRSLLALSLYYAFVSKFGSPFVSFGSDDFGYHMRAQVLAAQWTSGKVYYPRYHAAAYDSLIALFYFVFGPVPLVVRTLNCFAGALCAIYAYRIAKHLFGPVVGRISGFLVAFMPDLLFWSAVQYRDIILAAFALYLIWFLITQVHSIASSYDIIWPIIVFGMFLLFDIYGALGLLAVVFIYTYIERFNSKYANLPRTRALQALFLVALLGLFVGVSSLRKEGSVTSIFTVQNIMRERLVTRSTSESLSNIFLRERAGLGDALTAPIRFFLPIVLPIPSFSIELDLILLYIGSLIWYLLLPCALYGLAHCLRNRPRDTLPLYAIPLLSLIGLYVSFYAGVLRYRIRFMPLLWILTAVGLVYMPYWHRKYVLSLIVIALLFLTYVSLKAGAL